MLFSRRPKFRREDVYDRERELRVFSRGIEVGEGLIIVYGVRRIGKTSFVQVAFTELDMPYIPIDLRRHSESPSLLTPSAIAHVIDEVLKVYEGFTGKVKGVVERILQHIESLDLKLLKVKTRRSKRLLVESLERANRWAMKRGTRVAIVLDEAQELRIIPVWRSILAWCVDTLENVTVVATGSEVGVLNEFLKLDDPKSPLFGRPRLEIRLGKFTREQSIDYLKRGFEEANVRITDNEIEDAVDKLNGIIGWLNHYGYYRVFYRMKHSEALKQLQDEAGRLIGEELES